MTTVSKRVYIDILDKKSNKYNNRYYSTIKKKPIDVKSETYWLSKCTEFGIES